MEWRHSTFVRQFFSFSIMSELSGGVAFAYAKTPAILVFTRLTIWVAWCMFSKKTTAKELVPIKAGGDE